MSNKEEDYTRHPSSINWDDETINDKLMREETLLSETEPVSVIGEKWRYLIGGAVVVVPVYITIDKILSNIMLR